MGTLRADDVTNGAGTGPVNFPQGFQTSGVTTVGTGEIGELLEDTESSGVSMTTATGTAVMSLSLTAGVWDVSGVVTFERVGGGAVVSSEMVCEINSTSGSVAGSNGDERTFYDMSDNDTNEPRLNIISIPTVTKRITLGSTTTYYLNASITFSGGGTCVTKGRFRAVRIR